MTALEKFQDLLRKLFQFDCADLDFGIYRIMNQKRDVIEAFVGKELVKTVRGQLGQGALKEQDELATRLKELETQIRENIDDNAIDPDGNLDAAHHKTKLGKQYLELRERGGQAVALPEIEATVYNHLYAFFSRYYDNGDFMSLRRYSKREKYAIPYNGEEVYLHWANSDQYYVKTSEYFTDYQWKTPDGKLTVDFKLVQAESARDNVKAAEKRFFLPVLDETELKEVGRRSPNASPGLGFGEAGPTVIIPFHYRPLTEQEALTCGKKNQQDKIIADAMARVPKLKLFKSQPEVLAALLAETRRDANGDPVSLLEHHLRSYTRRNTSDFFIHKDLGGFLTRELDFYLKNEVLNLDSLEGGGEARAEGWFQLMHTIRVIGAEIITFVAQIENFQKRLFEKKKFVTDTHYCITLDRVPKSLYPRIVKNKAQVAEWVRLFAIDDVKGFSKPLKESFLKANPFLVLDTSLFAEDPGLIDELLAAIPDIDAQTDGLLVHGENFQALGLLQERYREQVKCVYIDPPYNTGSDENFPYKDNYQHSTWLSMLTDRFHHINTFQPREGTLIVSIDDAELPRLLQHAEGHYGQCIATLVWDRNRKNDAKFFSVGHEYMCVFGKDVSHLKESGVRFREPKEGLAEAKALFTKLRRKHRDDWGAIRNDWLAWFDEIPQSDPRRRLMRFSKVCDRGPYRDDGNINWPGGGGPRYRILHPRTQEPCKIPVSGWRYPTEERFWEEHEKGKIAFGADATTVPSVVAYLFESDDQVMPSVFYSYAQTAAQEFDHLFGRRIFDNPKNWRDIARLVAYLGTLDGVVLDCFGGSGTTAHAVINLNREDGGARKYILAEMGDYFDTVMKPRIAKVVYSKDWKDGKPVSREGSSHCFKVIRLESYDDTLGNISFDREVGQGMLNLLEGDDYLLNYMLEFETRGSETLLNVEKLSMPFSYKLEIMDGQARRVKTVDLPETFNYLIGLRVRTRQVLVRTKGKAQLRYVVITGSTNANSVDGEREVVVIWRETEGWKQADLEADRAFVLEHKLTDGAQDVYVNGDALIPGATALDGLFKQRMFAGVTS